MTKQEINRCNKCGKFVSKGVELCDDCKTPKDDKEWKKYLIEE